MKLKIIMVMLLVFVAGMGVVTQLAGEQQADNNKEYENMLEGELREKYLQYREQNPELYDNNNKIKKMLLDLERRVDFFANDPFLKPHVEERRKLALKLYEELKEVRRFLATQGIESSSLWGLFNSSLATVKNVAMNHLNITGSSKWG